MTNVTPTPNKGPWNTAEDAALRAIIASMSGTDCDGSYWVKIASIMSCRSAKQCRERWHQSLKPGLNHGPITPREADIIVQHVHKYGQQWAKIARELPGRSDNMIKNWWNGSANRRLKEQSHVASQAANVAVYESYPTPVTPTDIQRRATAPYVPLPHEYRPRAVEPYPGRGPVEHQRVLQEPFAASSQLHRSNTDSRRATIPHSNYSPYPPPGHQESFAAPRLSQDSRGPASATQEHNSKRPTLPPIHNLFQRSSQESVPSVHSVPTSSRSYSQVAPPVTNPLATPQVSPTDSSPRHRDLRNDSFVAPQHYHHHNSQYSPDSANSWRNRGQSFRVPNGEAPPKLVTSVTTSPPTEVPTLVRETAASDSPPFRSPITPAYPTFPPGSQNALGEPQQRNDSTGSSVGCPHHSGRCSCTTVTHVEASLKAVKREREEEQEGLPEDQGERSAKRHCRGKMDLKLVTN